MDQGGYGGVTERNGRLRDACVDETAFRSLGHARELITEWCDDDNNRRPPTSLGGHTPVEFASRSNRAIESTACRYDRVTLGGKVTWLRSYVSKWRAGKDSNPRPSDP